MARIIGMLMAVLMIMTLTSCGDLSGDPSAKAVVQRNTIYVPAPSKESLYPTKEELDILETAFSAPEMKWTPEELNKIAIHRNALTGIFAWIDQKRDVSSNVTFSDLKVSSDQGQWHYGELKSLLDSRKSTVKGVYIEAWVIYNNRITFIKQNLKNLNMYINSKEYDINSDAEAFDWSIFSSAFGAIEPLVGVLL